MEWALDHAQAMLVSAILKRTEGYKAGLEAQFKGNNELAGMKDLGLNQRRDLLAVDNLTPLLKTFQPNQSK